MAITPIMVDLEKQQVIIVGGGRVCERRVHTLLESGALLSIISPKIEQGIRSLWEEGRVNWRKKHVVAEDLKGAFLIIVATNDPKANQTVIEAAPPGCLLNVAADATLGNVHFPSHFKQGKLTIGVSTNGASPLLSAKIKTQLQSMFDKEYGEYIDFLYESRQLIKHSMLAKKEQHLLLKELLSDHFFNKDNQEKTVDWLKWLVR